MTSRLVLAAPLACIFFATLPAFAFPAENLPTGLTSEPTVKKLVIGLLMPEDDSPFLSAAKIVGNGLAAASKTSGRNVEVLQIEASSAASLDAQIDAAVSAGVDVVVGPLQKNAVEILVRRTSLPLPVVALNTSDTPNLSACPNNLIMMSVSTEREAQFIAQAAARSLTTAPQPAKAAILAGPSAWEQKLSETYQQALGELGVDFDVFQVDEEHLAELQKTFEPKLSFEDLQAFEERRKEIQKTVEEGHQLKRALAAVTSEEKAKIAMSDPPYAAALLALDIQGASLIRNRLPRLMRVWATSASNPGDPRTSSTSATLTYDLEKVVFSECPIVVRYDAQGFEARFRTAMPYSLAAKRLFALGVDAFSVALDWSAHREEFSIDGQTGGLTLDRSASPVVNRKPQLIGVEGGRLIELTMDEAEKGKFPEKSAVEETAPLASVEEVFGNVRRTDVAPVTAEDLGDGPSPSPILNTPKKLTLPTQAQP